MSVLKILKAKEKFSSIEIDLADYILENPKKVTGMTVEDLAKATFTSPATIVRLCKKLDTKGYSDFKIKLAMDIQESALGPEIVEVNMPINRGDTTEEITQKMLNLHHQALVDTFNTLDIELLQKAVDIINEADVIYLFGVGNSLVIAEEMHYKMRNLGVPIVSNPLLGFDNFQLKQSNLKHVAIIISKYGNSYKVRNWMKYMKNSHVPIVYIHSNRKSPLVKMAEYPICIDNEETRVEKFGAFSSRTSMLYVTDCLYLMLFMKNYERNMHTLKDMSKRINESNEYFMPNL